MPVVGIFIILAHLSKTRADGLQKFFVQQFEHAVHAVGEVHFRYLVSLLQGALLYLHNILLVHEQDRDFEIGVWEFGDDPHKLRKYEIYVI